MWLAVPVIWGADNVEVSGIVRNSLTGQPVKETIVRLSPMAQEGIGYAGSSTETGAFEFSVEPGDYRLKLDCPGYTSVEELLFLKAGENQMGLVLEAVPLGVITGTVADGDGEPVIGAQVRAIGYTWVFGKRVYQQVQAAESDDRGEFRLAGLEPGKYRLFASPPPSFSISEGPGAPEYHLVGSYYPRGQDLDGAAPVDLAPGQELTGIGFKLGMAPAFHIRGSTAIGVVSRPGNWNAPLTAAAVRLDGGREADWFEVSARLRKDGTFDISGVPAGRYRVSIQRFGQLTESADVTAGERDATDLSLGQIRRASVRVRFTWADADDAAAKHDSPTMTLFQTDGPRLIARPDGFGGFGRTQQRQADGSLLYENLAPGKYQPVLVATTGYFVQSMTFNGQAVRADGIAVGSGSAGELDMVLAPGVGSISGVVKTPGETEVKVVADDAIIGNAGVMGIGIDADGRFSFSNLPPGHYLIFAIPRGLSLPWGNAAFDNLLRDHGAAVELRESGSGTAEVSVIRAEVLRQAEEQIP